MRLLLDTHVLLALGREDVDPPPPRLQTALEEASNRIHASVASYWEAAIKHRLGKLTLPCPLQMWPAALEQFGVTSVAVSLEHVIAEVTPWPDTRDPFDRLLLAVAQVERMQLVTLDEKLLDHPLAWRPA